MDDSSLPSPIYVFTCLGGDGHFLYAADGRRWASDVPRAVSDSCDVQSDPNDPYGDWHREEPEGRIRATAPPPGWSYVAWWDRQGDSRRKSTTGILARGQWTAQQLIDAARRDAPWALRVRVYGPGVEEVADAR